MTRTAGERPVLDVPRTPVEIAVEAAAFAGVLALAWILASQWPDLPQRVPRHFNAAGAPDAWGCKGSLLPLPAIALAVYIGLSLLSLVPHRLNYPVRLTADNAARQYLLGRMLVAVLKTEIVWLLTYGVWQTMRVARGQATGLGSGFLPAMLAALVLPIAVYLLAAARAR